MIPAFGGGGSGSVRVRGAARRGVSTNKGFARRPQRLLEGLYVAIPACGGEWEWEWECARAAARTTNKGFARRPQRLLEGPYVAIPAFGGGWECGRVRRATIKVSQGGRRVSWRGRM